MLIAALNEGDTDVKQSKQRLEVCEAEPEPAGMSARSAAFLPSAETCRHVTAVQQGKHFMSEKLPAESRQEGFIGSRIK